MLLNIVIQWSLSFIRQSLLGLLKESLKALARLAKGLTQGLQEDALGTIMGNGQTPSSLGGLPRKGVVLLHLPLQPF